MVKLGYKNDQAWLNIAEVSTYKCKLDNKFGLMINKLGNAVTKYGNTITKFGYISNKAW